MWAVEVEDRIKPLVPISIAGARIQLELLHQFAEGFVWDGMHDGLAAKMLAGLRVLEGVTP